MKVYNGIHVTPWITPGVTCGYRAGRWVKGVLVEILYSEDVPAGSPAAWLDKARQNCIRRADAAKVNSKGVSL